MDLYGEEDHPGEFPYLSLQVVQGEENRFHGAPAGLPALRAAGNQIDAVQSVVPELLSATTERVAVPPVVAGGVTTMA